MTAVPAPARRGYHCALCQALRQLEESSRAGVKATAAERKMRVVPANNRRRTSA